MAEPIAAAATFFDPAGKPLQGPELDKAWAEGTAHVAAGTQVHMLDENGDLRLVPAERVAAARSKGYAPAPAEVVEQRELQREHGGIAGQAATFAESAADTASIGGFGFAAGHLAPGYAHDVAQRREANPITHIAGSIAGLVPSIVAGGEGAEAGELGELAEVAKAPGLAKRAIGAIGAPLRYVEEGGSIVQRGIQRGLASLGVPETGIGRVATKVLSRAGAGAAEGAAFGVGSTLSESSLEGKDLTGEALVSGIGRNALFGGLIGAGESALGELGSAAIKKLTPAKEKLEAFAERQGARAIGTSGKDVEKLGGLESSKFKSTMDEMLGYEYMADGAAGKKGQRLWSAATNVTEIHDGLRQAAQETGAAKRGVVEEIDNAIRSDPKVAAVAQPDVGEFFDRVKSDVLDKLKKSDVMGDRRMALKIEREIQPLHDAYLATKNWTAGEVAANDALGATAGPLEAIGRSPLPPEPITFARMDEFEQRLSRQIYGEPVKGAGIQVAPKGAKQLERVRGILSDWQDKNAERALAAMGEDPSKLSELNRQYSSFAALEKIAGREAGKAAKNRMASPTDHALGMAGFLGSLLSGNVGTLGAMAYGAAATLANNFARTRGNSILADIAFRTSRMDHLLENTAHALSISPEEILKPVELARGGLKDQSRERLTKSDYEPLGVKALHKDFAETTERVRAMAEPVAQHEQVTHATKEISEHYPEQGAVMAAKILAIHQHLQEVMPQPQGGSQISPMAATPRVPPREQARFLTRVNAALDPGTVIADIGKGKLDKDAIDTLKQVYPATYGVLRQKVMTKLAASDEELPYQRVIHIGSVFDFDSDPSLTRIASIQQTIAQINAPPSAGPGAPGKPKRGNPVTSKVGTSFSLPGAAVAGAH